jgi:cytochrome b6-f complex iron-sulfur subunit
MAEKISELSGEAREQRIAELKAKMQEAAKKAAAAKPASESHTASSPAAAAAISEPAVVAEAELPQTESTALLQDSAPSAGNGAAAPKVAAAPKPVAPKALPKPAAEPAQDAATPRDMTRRELFTYAWGGALAILGLETLAATGWFMYPRFKAGEFGGAFTVPEANWPSDPKAAPVGETAGKFWMVTTEGGDPKAIYMVCTHLGCLYKWVEANFRFECPCHGSKFTHDGFYIEGPAPRSLDSFEVTVGEGAVVVNTGKKITGSPSVESPARAVA